jgi:hypothetical protein
MHGQRDWLVRLKTELADQNFILIQNGISVENVKEGKSISQGGGVTRAGMQRVTDRFLQHHAYDIDIA